MTYQELREKAIRTEAQNDIMELVAWLNQNDPSSWNGECYDISAEGEPTGTTRLYPVYDWDAHTQDEIDDGIEPDAWEIR